MTIPSEVKNGYFFEKCNKIWKKVDELMGINFEIKPPFHNNTACRTKGKILSLYSEDLSGHKNLKKRNNL